MHRNLLGGRLHPYATSDAYSTKSQVCDVAQERTRAILQLLLTPPQRVHVRLVVSQHRNEAGHLCTPSHWEDTDAQTG